VRGVLFDLDGTLVDNMRFHIEAWLAMGEQLGHPLTAEQIMREFAGRRNEEILPRILGRALGAEELSRLAAQKENHYRVLFAPHLRLIAGAAQFMDELTVRGIPFGVATAAPRENRAFVLGGLGLHERLACVVGAEEVARGKPAPDLFLEGARRLERVPGDIVVFEDARLGIQAARAAGMRAYGITTGEGAAELLEAGASAAFADFTALPANLLV
jgi:beta-phosphoglucomutase